MAIALRDEGGISDSRAVGHGRIPALSREDFIRVVFSSAYKQERRLSWSHSLFCDY